MLGICLHERGQYVLIYVLNGTQAANKHDMRLDCFPDIKRPENDVRAFGVDVLQRLEVFLRLF